MENYIEKTVIFTITNSTFSPVAGTSGNTSSGCGHLRQIVWHMIELCGKS